MDDRTPQQRRNARRTAILLGVVAVAFYLGFILVEYIRSQGG